MDNKGMFYMLHGSVQDCSISIVNALEILQACTKPSIYNYGQYHGCCRDIPGVYGPALLAESRDWP